MRYIEEFRNPVAAAKLLKSLRLKAGRLKRIINIMEVCGSHTMAISRYAIRQSLPGNIKLISGPGCPVCVTGSGFIDAALCLAGSGKTVASFGDLLNVPGSTGTLEDARSAGADIEICYSPLQALNRARQDTGKDVVFLGIGFETTAPVILSVLEKAARNGIKNFSVLTAFKTVPAALKALTDDPDVKVDAFLCPAHVSAITGSAVYENFARNRETPCVIAGFEPLDILLGITGIIDQILQNSAFADNQYSRVVKRNGNLIAAKLISRYLEPVDACWRGLGIIKASGLKLKKEFSAFDSAVRYGITIQNSRDMPGCRCGDVLKGKITPRECSLFSTKCTPLNPAGPCMVSSEGACAAYYKYEMK